MAQVGILVPLILDLVLVVLILFVPLECVLLQVFQLLLLAHQLSLDRFQVEAPDFIELGKALFCLLCEGA